jgi:hypothetical protein
MDILIEQYGGSRGSRDLLSEDFSDLGNWFEYDHDLRSVCADEDCHECCGESCEDVESIPMDEEVSVEHGDTSDCIKEVSVEHPAIEPSYRTRALSAQAFKERYMYADAMQREALVFHAHNSVEEIYSNFLKWGLLGQTGGIEEIVYFSHAKVNYVAIYFTSEVNVYDIQSHVENRPEYKCIPAFDFLTNYL